MSNLDLYQARVGNSSKTSKSKLIDNKIKTFKKALERSYNSEIVYGSDGRRIEALISSIPTSPTIRKKNFSTLKTNGCGVGDIILWESEESRWIITEHDDGEPAVFQGSIQECIYEIKWKDPNSNKIYETWAAAKGPEETTITNGVKHSIFFDRLTDSLYLIVSKKELGTDLLRRYFQIMVNGVKWEIEVADYMTRQDLIYLDLKQVSLDRDRDTEELVDGKIDDAFKITTLLDNVKEVKQGSKLKLEPILTHKGTMVEDEIKIKATNAEVNGNEITFTQQGEVNITAYNDTYESEKKLKINVLSALNNPVTVKEVIGSKSVKTLSAIKFRFVVSTDGEVQENNGRWEYDSNYFIIEEETKDVLKLKARNKTGITEIVYIDGDEQYVHEVKITPLFGGR